MLIATEDGQLWINKDDFGSGTVKIGQFYI